jgi:hypothetical protein
MPLLKPRIFFREWQILYIMELEFVLYFVKRNYIKLNKLEIYTYLKWKTTFLMNCVLCSLGLHSFCLLSEKCDGIYFKHRDHRWMN